MADTNKITNGPSPFAPEAYDPLQLPDYDNDFINEADIDEFIKALKAPDASQVTALNDWRPVHQRVRRRSTVGRKRKSKRRSTDETREGFVYAILSWPLLVLVSAWIMGLSYAYILTRAYVWLYEQLITWRGVRQRLRTKAREATNYSDWLKAAKELDAYLGNDEWKERDVYAYYDHLTVKRAKEQLQERRERAQAHENQQQRGQQHDRSLFRDVDELRGLVEACVKNNFAGIENPRLYSETYYGTKELAQDFVDELDASLAYLLKTPVLNPSIRFTLAKHLHTNLGRTALCLSGGATFAYYHFGVAKALLDASLLPDVITGTSGGALVAALVATRTDGELKRLLVPALADRIRACNESFDVWSRRWWRTGARFDSGKWARECAWFCRGSMTFREAYERTGRILNVTCIPSNPHSPTILANYLTAPDCVIWSAVLASAAVPGILNPVVLMTKTRAGTLAPYSFGHKWKDGSLRTDIPLRALNTHFNVTFSIVSQVNPHIRLFFFSSRGTVGRPVTHRRGRGWRGGYLGSAIEQYLKLDLNKWLKVLRHLELLPRVMGQDWSEIWLQKFGGTITIAPRTRLSDFLYILSDPPPERLAYMLQAGQLATFPKLLFVANRMKLERRVQQGLLQGQRHDTRPGSLHLHGQEIRSGAEDDGSGVDEDVTSGDDETMAENMGIASRMYAMPRQSSGMMAELKRQSGVFFDDTDDGDTDGSGDGSGDGIAETIELETAGI